MNQNRGFDQLSPSARQRRSTEQDGDRDLSVEKLPVDDRLFRDLLFRHRQSADLNVYLTQLPAHQQKLARMFLFSVRERNPSILMPQSTYGYNLLWRGMERSLLHPELHGLGRELLLAQSPQTRWQLLRGCKAAPASHPAAKMLGEFDRAHRGLASRLSANRGFLPAEERRPAQIASRSAESELSRWDVEIAAPEATGAPLPKQFRQQVEQLFDHPLDHVEICTGGEAEQFAGRLQARAVTVGHRIFFAPGLYDPKTTHGRRLLLHELTHVVQHDRGKMPQHHGASRLQILGPQHQLEREARAAESKIDRLFQPTSLSNKKFSAHRESRSIASAAPLRLASFPSHIVARGKIPKAKAATAARKSLTERAYEWTLERAKGQLASWGIDPSQFVGFFQQAPDMWGVLKELWGSPWQFLVNFKDAMFGGFKKFYDNIGQHLKDGLAQWLTGSTGVFLSEFTFRGLFQTALSLFQFTPDAALGRISGRLKNLTNPKEEIAAAQTVEEQADHVQAQAEAQVIADADRKGWGQTTRQKLKVKGAAVKQRVTDELKSQLHFVRDYIEAYRKNGFAGLWEEFKGSLSGIFGGIFEEIKAYVTQTVVWKGIEYLASMLTPIGGLVQIAKILWKAIQWLWEQGARLIRLVQSIAGALNSIAKRLLDDAIGNIAGALVTGVPLVISALAKLLGLDGMAARFRNFLERARDHIWKAIDKLIDRVAVPLYRKYVQAWYEKRRAKQAAKRLAEQNSLSGEQAQTAGAVQNSKIEGERKIPLFMARAAHTLFIFPNREPELASVQLPLSEKIERERKLLFVVAPPVPAERFAHLGLIADLRLRALKRDHEQERSIAKLKQALESYGSRWQVTDLGIDPGSAETKLGERLKLGDRQSAQSIYDELRNLPFFYCPVLSIDEESIRSDGLPIKSLTLTDEEVGRMMYLLQRSSNTSSVVATDLQLARRAPIALLSDRKAALSAAEKRYPFDRLLRNLDQFFQENAFGTLDSTDATFLHSVADKIRLLVQNAKPIALEVKLGALDHLSSGPGVVEVIEQFVTDRNKWFRTEGGKKRPNFPSDRPTRDMLLTELRTRFSRASVTHVTAQEIMNFIRAPKPLLNDIAGAAIAKPMVLELDMSGHKHKLTVPFDIEGRKDIIMESKPKPLSVRLAEEIDLAQSSGEPGRRAEVKNLEKKARAIVAANGRNARRAAAGDFVNAAESYAQKTARDTLGSEDDTPISSPKSPVSTDLLQSLEPGHPPMPANVMFETWYGLLNLQHDNPDGFLASQLSGNTVARYPKLGYLERKDNKFVLPQKFRWPGALPERRNWEVLYNQKWANLCWLYDACKKAGFKGINHRLVEAAKLADTANNYTVSFTGRPARMKHGDDTYTILKNWIPDRIPERAALDLNILELQRVKTQWEVLQEFARKTPYGWIWGQQVSDALSINGKVAICNYDERLVRYDTKVLPAVMFRLKADPVQDPLPPSARRIEHVKRIYFAAVSRGGNISTSDLERLRRAVTNMRHPDYRYYSPEGMADLVELKIFQAVNGDRWKLIWGLRNEALGQVGNGRPGRASEASENGSHGANGTQTQVRKNAIVLHFNMSGHAHKLTVPETGDDIMMESRRKRLDIRLREESAATTDNGAKSAKVTVLKQKAGAIKSGNVNNRRDAAAEFIAAAESYARDTGRDTIGVEEDEEDSATKSTTYISSREVPLDFNARLIVETEWVLEQIPVDHERANKLDTIREKMNVFFKAQVAKTTVPFAKAEADLMELVNGYRKFYGPNALDVAKGNVAKRSGKASKPAANILKDFVGGADYYSEILREKALAAATQVGCNTVVLAHGSADGRCQGGGLKRAAVRSRWEWIDPVQFVNAAAFASQLPARKLENERMAIVGHYPAPVDKRWFLEFMNQRGTQELLIFHINYKAFEARNVQPELRFKEILEQDDHVATASQSWRQPIRANGDLYPPMPARARAETWYKILKLQSEHDSGIPWKKAQEAGVYSTLMEPAKKHILPVTQPSAGIFLVDVDYRWRGEFPRWEDFEAVMNRNWGRVCGLDESSRSTNGFSLAQARELGLESTVKNYFDSVPRRLDRDATTSLYSVVETWRPTIPLPSWANVNLPARLTTPKISEKKQKSPVASDRLAKLRSLANSEGEFTRQRVLAAGFDGPTFDQLVWHYGKSRGGKPALITEKSNGANKIYKFVDKDADFSKKTDNWTLICQVAEISPGHWIRSGWNSTLTPAMTNQYVATGALLKYETGLGRANCYRIAKPATPSQGGPLPQVLVSLLSDYHFKRIFFSTLGTLITVEQLSALAKWLPQSQQYNYGAAKMAEYCQQGIFVPAGEAAWRIALPGYHLQEANGDGNRQAMLRQPGSNGAQMRARNQAKGEEAAAQQKPRRIVIPEVSDTQGLENFQLARLRAVSNKQLPGTELLASFAETPRARALIAVCLQQGLVQERVTLHRQLGRDIVYVIVGNADAVRSARTRTTRTQYNQSGGGVLGYTKEEWVYWDRASRFAFDEALSGPRTHEERDSTWVESYLVRIEFADDQMQSWKVRGLLKRYQSRLLKVGLTKKERSAFEVAARKTNPLLWTDSPEMTHLIIANGDTLTEPRLQQVFDHIFSLRPVGNSQTKSGDSDEGGRREYRLRQSSRHGRMHAKKLPSEPDLDAQRIADNVKWDLINVGRLRQNVAKLIPTARSAKRLDLVQIRVATDKMNQGLRLVVMSPEVTNEHERLGQQLRERVNRFFAAYKINLLVQIGSTKAVEVLATTMGEQITGSPLLDLMEYKTSNVMSAVHEGFVNAGKKISADLVVIANTGEDGKFKMGRAEGVVRRSFRLSGIETVSLPIDLMASKINQALHHQAVPTLAIVGTHYVSAAVKRQVEQLALYIPVNVIRVYHCDLSTVPRTLHDGRKAMFSPKELFAVSGTGKVQVKAEDHKAPQPQTPRKSRVTRYSPRGQYKDICRELTAQHQQRGYFTKKEAMDAGIRREFFAPTNLTLFPWIEEVGKEGYRYTDPLDEAVVPVRVKDATEYLRQQIERFSAKSPTGWFTNKMIYRWTGKSDATMLGPLIRSGWLQKVAVYTSLSSNGQRRLGGGGVYYYRKASLGIPHKELNNPTLQLAYFMVVSKLESGQPGQLTGQELAMLKIPEARLLAFGDVFSSQIDGTTSIYILNPKYYEKS